MNWREKVLIGLLMVLCLIVWFMVIASTGFEGNGPGRLPIKTQEESYVEGY